MLPPNACKPQMLINRSENSLETLMLNLFGALLIHCIEKSTLSCHEEMSEKIGDWSENCMHIRERMT